MAVDTRDIEESEGDLDSYIEETLDFWTKKQRELVTSVVDYNLKAISELITDQSIDLQPRYQRRTRWLAEKQSKLIESFLMNVPVPPVFLSEDELGVYSVIDGKQRLTAIHSFLTNNLRLKGLEVFNDINGEKFFDLPKTLQTILRTRPTIRAVIILRQSDPDIKYEVFQRLNTGGAHLNPQEIRNNAFAGPLNDLIMHLAESRAFRGALGIKNPDRSAIYRDMRDAEFVLRFFTFHQAWDTFKGGIRRAMDSYMEHNRRLPPARLQELEDTFNRTLDNVVCIFGDAAFQRWIPEKGVWRKQVLAALFDAQMFSCQYLSNAQARSAKNSILEDYKSLFSDDEFRKSIDAATNNPTYFRQRIERSRILS